jgi:hypothetical protein
MAESEKTFSKTIPPPVLGWNTKDPISQMNELFSPGIENYFPGNGTVSLRNGYTKHVISATAGTFVHLAEYVNNAGSHFLIGFASLGSQYNVTSAGAGTALTGAVSITATEFYTVNYRGLLFIKGYNTLGNPDMYYTDGTNLTAAAFTGPGGDDKDLWRLTTYKGRLYALTISDASMWYAGLDSITGAMTQFDFQSLLTLGGKPWYIGTFSMTGGDISQEYFCMISEQGEVYIYEGDYPGAGNWAVASHFFIPAPVGRKSFFNWRSDILIITYDGLVSLREYIGTPAGEDYVFLSDNIASEFKSAVADVASSANQIQGIVYPRGQYLLVNFYDSLFNPFQFVMNTQTRGWTKFTGQKAACWSLLNNRLYFGGTSQAAVSPKLCVSLADNGAFDQNPDDDSVITRTTKLRFAFNYLDQPHQTKILTECVPIVYESENLDLTLNADVDYSDTTATSANTTTGDTSYKLYSNVRCGLKADPGKAVSIRLDGTATTKRRSIQAVEVFWKDGGIR